MKNYFFIGFLFFLNTQLSAQILKSNTIDIGKVKPLTDVMGQVFYKLDINDLKTYYPNTVVTYESGHSFIDYSQLAPILLSYIQRLVLEIESNQSLYFEMMERNNNLRKEIELLKRRIKIIENEKG